MYRVKSLLRTSQRISPPGPKKVQHTSGPYENTYILALASE